MYWVRTNALGRRVACALHAVMYRLTLVETQPLPSLQSGVEHVFQHEGCTLEFPNLGIFADPLGSQKTLLEGQ